ncbi:MAG TPA: nuclear transport factor 2 family protein [Steroidobacteraceae bacterium]|nr:nuclear transport factor 2 family protein [Steroidobacteraceae bacterium]
MARFITALCGTALAVAGVTAFTAPAQAADTTASSDKAAIQALEARFAAAFNAGDVDAIMRLYEPGSSLFVFDVTPPRQHVGWADYRADWVDTFKSMPPVFHFSLSDLTVTVVGPVAYGHSIQSEVFTRKNGSKGSVVVRVTDVYRKIRGRWLIVQEHVSVPVDVTTGKADLLSKP